MVAALNAGIHVDGGIVVAWGVRKACERRSLIERQILRVLVEVGDGSRFDAVGAMPIVNGVQIHVEDLVFGVGLFHLNGYVGLAHLALERVVELLVRKDRVTYKLLRDGRRAFGAA